MHPKLEHLLNDYHAHELVLTAVRSDQGSVGWMLTINSRILTWDGWYAAEYLRMDEVPDLLDLVPEDGTIEDLRAANRRQLGAVTGFLWMFPDGMLAPDLLAARVSDGSPGAWSASRLTADEKGWVREADPLAYLSLGSPDGLRRLAGVLREVS